ncbi:MAG TPA: type II toxin-antitoxin system antitoxin SocA domain-containing protein [Rhizomicrobium sp.]|jgi:uncharacterized phage-associated protein|nr:type II toxin-antitoxin system antitoxin SocA domain-containing protein [Rhizomicrobium sp.]
MNYSAGHIANFMLDKGDKEQRAISPMKLLKLVYMAYGWSLAVLDEKLFDETIYAWAHGPVVRSVYDEFKHFGKAPIDCFSTDFNLETFEITIPRVPASDTEVNVVLGKVWGVYKHFDAWALRGITHEAGSPWQSVYRPDARNIPIPDNLIKPYFKSKVRQYLDNADGTGSVRSARN